MPSPLRCRIIGVHPFIPSVAVFDETLVALYGGDLDGFALEQAKSQVTEHFDGLHVVEIEFVPSADELDWSEITQPVAGTPRSNWQVPYDEQALDTDRTRWVFFFHFLDFRQPLMTPCGPVTLPAVTPLPNHLQGIEYWAP